MTAPDVRWLGALWVGHRGRGLLLDAPDGIHRTLRRDGLLETLDAVVVTSARTPSMAGLIGLADALSAIGRSSLVIAHVLGDERTPLLAQAWTQGWPDGLRLELDGLAPGGVLDVGPFVVELVPVRLGEGTSAGVRPVAGCAARVSVGPWTLAWVPAARPGTATARAAAGADLAVIEVERRPWPQPTPGWRLGLAEAQQVANGARSAWIVGDDGARLDDGAEH